MREKSSASVIATSLFLAICCLQIAPSLQACTGNCQQIWDPVCGSDGRTYANKCIAKCAGVSVKHAGRCKTFDREQALAYGTFACTDNCEQKWDPVCGSNGKTYANKCIAKCAGVSVKHAGRCKAFEAFACTDSCEQKWDPVCGSNGKTYANKCIAKCAGVSVKHAGRCKTFDREQALTYGTFACTDNCEQKWDPVCASNGKTYANKCIAKCAGVSVKHAGRCKAFRSGVARLRAESQPCGGRNQQPVCGNNGRTYDNLCKAVAAGISVAHIGTCRHCSGVYDPVCGVDNRTYANACLALRANVAIKHPGPCMR